MIFVTLCLEGGEYLVGYVISLVQNFKFDGRISYTLLLLHSLHFSEFLGRVKAGFFA